MHPTVKLLDFVQNPHYCFNYNKSNLIIIDCILFVLSTFFAFATDVLFEEKSFLFQFTSSQFLPALASNRLRSGFQTLEFSFRCWNRTSRMLYRGLQDSRQCNHHDSQGTFPVRMPSIGSIRIAFGYSSRSYKKLLPIQPPEKNFSEIKFAGPEKLRKNILRYRQNVCIVAMARRL